jgi:hypothetical protein
MVEDITANSEDAMKNMGMNMDQLKNLQKMMGDMMKDNPMGQVRMGIQSDNMSMVKEGA